MHAGNAERPLCIMITTDKLMADGGGERAGTPDDMRIRAPSKAYIRDALASERSRAPAESSSSSLYSSPAQSCASFRCFDPLPVSTQYPARYRCCQSEA